ncbi:MAG: GFA family protein [Sphingobium sp.]
MTGRTASCSCGELRLTCEGDPVRISICHCLECQKRTGSVFAAQARFPRERVRIEGHSSRWARTGDSGTTATFHFCPVCGSTLYWVPGGAPGFVAVAVGAFADPGFPPPHVSVYEERQHPWALSAEKLPLEHIF